MVVVERRKRCDLVGVKERASEIVRTDPRWMDVLSAGCGGLVDERAERVVECGSVVRGGG